MSYAQPKSGTRHVIGMGAVIGLHVLLVYALANGLGSKVLEVIKKPLTVSLIEEAKPETPPPPPPPPRVVQPRVVQPPPPAYVPPPEVTPPPSVVPPPVMAQVTTTPPPVVEPTPAPPTPPAPPVEPAKPTLVNVSIACPNHQAVQSRVEYPPQALRQGISGEVVVEFLVGTDGSISDVSVIKTPSKVFNAAVTSAVSRLQCQGQSAPVKVRIPFVFALEN